MAHNSMCKRMNICDHFRITSFLIVIVFGVLMSEGEQSVTYNVLPTEPIGSCHGQNSTCPPGQLCYTMDYLVEHSSEFFSLDHINVTLRFLCGIHRYTKNLTVQNLHSFVMKGATESRENVIVDNRCQATTMSFSNASFVNITRMTMKCPLVKFNGGIFTARDVNFYGKVAETREVLSSISLQTVSLLENCSFKENCFVTVQKHSRMTINNSTFQSYRHESRSILGADSSIVTLTGHVTFANSTVGLYPSNDSSGTAIFLTNDHQEPELKSLLRVSTGATVHFINLTCNNAGGAIHVRDGLNEVDISSNSTVVFENNSAYKRGGALCLWPGSSLNIGEESRVVFNRNTAFTLGGGAIFAQSGSITIGNRARVRFSHNTAYSQGGGGVYFQLGIWNVSKNASVQFTYNLANMGGAIFISKAALHMNSNDIIFSSNTAIQGGALFLDITKMHIGSFSSVNFSSNLAQRQGGAVFITEINDQSIVVDNSSNLSFHNNSALQGGALYIIPTSFAIKIGSESITQFVDNTATDVGGAVYSELQRAQPCIFLTTNRTAGVSFVRNSASRGIGHHVYGTSIRSGKCDHSHIHGTMSQGIPYCYHYYQPSDNRANISFLMPRLNETLSPVSSSPLRVCFCDSDGNQPQCKDLSRIFIDVSTFRGEEFTLSACVVGYDFGTTSGSVYTEFLYKDPPASLKQSQYEQITNVDGHCSTLNYTVYTSSATKMLQLRTTGTSQFALYGDRKTLVNRRSQYVESLEVCLRDYNSHNGTGCLGESLLTSPVFINVTLLPGCPPGLTLTVNNTTCSCFSVLPKESFSCVIRKKIGYIQWLKNSPPVWVNATFDGDKANGIIYNRFCPLYYCKSGEKTVNVEDDPSGQCTSNRAGILCGACEKNFSLAIGSSRCIECPDSRNVSLLLAFLAAGVVLVFFILALNVTVTQGLINGFIFYANIVWAYKIVLFPSETALLPLLQVFVAWLNLDFGIEVCFFSGLDSYWKTWMQFLFPFYIWTLAGAIIVACRHSSRLTNLIGSRAVPLLATLFLLSYMKLFRTVVDATSVAVITHHPQNTSYPVWSLDGNLRYGQHPHIYLFLAAIATLLFLWLPYTLILLFIQPLRRVSHLRPLEWVNKLAPVFDAYFHPLKDKHHYWFGTMLLIRGVLLIILTATSTLNPEMNIFVLFLSMVLIFFYMSIKSVYKRKSVRVFESTILLNLNILSAGTLYKWESMTFRKTLLEVSIGIAFTQFCITAAWSFIKVFLASADFKCRQRNQYTDIDDENDIDELFAYERMKDPELELLINRSHASTDPAEPLPLYTQQE